LGLRGKVLKVFLSCHSTNTRKKTSDVVETKTSYQKSNYHIFESYFENIVIETFSGTKNVTGKSPTRNLLIFKKIRQ
jgi:cobalamin biosynthesis Co2+ chelatase CbiK